MPATILLTLRSSGPACLPAGGEMSFTIKTVDVPDDDGNYVVSYSLLNSLQEEVRFGSAQALEHTFSEAELPDDTYTIVASDQQGNTAQATFTINCVADPSAKLLVATVTPTGATQEGGPGLLTMVATGGTGPYSLEVVEAAFNVAAQPDQTITQEVAPGLYTVRYTDSATPPQIVRVSVVVPSYVGPPPVPSLPAPPAQNLETFPFSAEGDPFLDAPDPACADAPYYVAAPATGFLPFCLRRLKNPARWLDCARVLDAYTLEVLLEFDPRLLAYEKLSDGTHDYFVYYGAEVAGLTLPGCRALRLQVDEFTSVAFTAVADLSGHLKARWWHPTPLQHLPYGTGLEQWLYIIGATLREQQPREERTEVKNTVTGRVRVDFLAQSRAVSFDTEPLPGWLTQAVQGARLHQFFAAADFLQGGFPVKEVKQAAFGSLSCSSPLSLTLEYPPVVVVGCSPVVPALHSLPADYSRTC